MYARNKIKLHDCDFDEKILFCMIQFCICSRSAYIMHFLSILSALIATIAGADIIIKPWKCFFFSFMSIIARFFGIL